MANIDSDEWINNPNLPEIIKKCDILLLQTKIQMLNEIEKELNDNSLTSYFDSKQ